MSMSSIQFCVTSVGTNSQESSSIFHKLSLRTKVLPFSSQAPLGIPHVTNTSQPILLGGAQGYSTGFRSIVQLMNIAMMTDPWNFFWLRFIGVQLYLYRVRLNPVDTSDTFQVQALILPYAVDEMEEHTGLSRKDYALLETASSRDVPLFVLLQSG
ncbi:unnamed protein product [Phytophthora lilii]|uniref:Unnamed protein product n=1 Tax=Phytophthora lilii TaxID=2077276 RepID=A0A9W7CU29_9STRA|nr:unnamed protein product [Phytophthora lilii]